jgi:hypothetical protein
MTLSSDSPPEVQVWAKGMGGQGAVGFCIDFTQFTVADAVKEIHRQKPGIPLEYIRLHRRSPQPLDETQTFAELGIPPETTLFFTGEFIFSLTPGDIKAYRHFSTPDSGGIQL